MSCLLFVNGCSLPDFTSGDREAKKINTAFVEALGAKDKDGIKALLCEYTLEEEDIDEQIEDMFNFFDDSIFPIDKNDVWNMGAGAEEESIRNGKKTLKIAANLDIEKSQKKYLITCFAYICCSNSKKIGVSQIEVTDVTGFDVHNTIIELDDPSRQCFVGKYIE